MKWNPTHKGLIQGDARIDWKEMWVKLRETRCYWITEGGTKFRKNTGWSVGDSMWSLKIETVVPFD